MSTVNVKYIKDENGNIISPITNSSVVYLKNNPDTPLSNTSVTIRKTLYTGGVVVPSMGDSPLTLTYDDDVNNYTHLEIYESHGQVAVITTSTYNALILGGYYPNDSTSRGAIFTYTRTSDTTAQVKNSMFFDFNNGYQQGTSVVAINKVIAYKYVS